jgi:hypothetical protein
MDLGRARRAELPAFRTSALDRRQCNPDGCLIRNREVEDADPALANLVERHLTVRAMGFATPVPAHGDLHSDHFDPNLIHDTPGELV